MQIFSGFTIAIHMFSCIDTFERVQDAMEREMARITLANVIRGTKIFIAEETAPA